MKILDRKNLILLFVSLLMIFSGFLSMKLELTPHGYGPWALTIAPLLVISGFIVAIFSIFSGTGFKKPLSVWRPDIFVGWLMFAISFILYLITLEETASLWDCAEFIACAYKLQVPHAPGAPLFLMIGRLFSLLALGDTQHVAYWVNVSSALSSAFAVMFTFWSIVMLAKRINPNSHPIAGIIAGITGGLTIAFADSFWFSAVEAETYAMATLFLVLCFWAILKWQQKQDKLASAKWLVFILFVLGLSVGVHPMSLLIIPALAVIIAFKDRQFSWKVAILSIAMGASGILFLNHIILFGLPEGMKHFDILFVNHLNLPFYSGAIFLLVLLFVLGVFTYRWSVRNKRSVISVFIIGMMYFLLGYSSYFMILIRSQADPSIDEHNPENLMTLTSYLKRESYGTRPLLYGQYYNAKIEKFSQGAPVFSKMGDHYKITDHKAEYVYEKSHSTIFPRMYSNQENHIQTYREWTGLKDHEKPTFMDNLTFMFRYQFGHMYFRYLMFNFSGRASDIQHARWLSPLDVFEQIPIDLERNKARNNFLMLPLLLGIAGMIFQYKRDKAGFWTVMAFFLFLGFILVFYLNSPPNEPRERDYIYVGSYLAFAIWCGLGALSLVQFLKDKLGNIPVVRYVGLIGLVAPAMMLIEGFDDHDRSGRTLQVDHARNILSSCAPDAILFTGGDNDTFPLWYVQEVEDFRTDVRVIVLSYFNGDWYIDQMRRQMYHSPPLPFSLEKKSYRQGGLNDALPFVEQPGIRGAINLKKYLQLIREENRSLQVNISGGTKYNSVPARTFFLEIDQAQIINSNIVPKDYQSYIPEKLTMEWSGNFMEKSNLMALDLIAQNDWKRPIYFNITSLNSIGIELKHNVLQEGHVYRLLPVETDEGGKLNVERTYENLMEKQVYRDLSNPNIYYNHEDYQLRILQSTKSCYNALASALLDQGDVTRANEVMDFFLDHFIQDNIHYDISLVNTVDLLYSLKKHNAADDISAQLYALSEQKLEYLYEQNMLMDTEARMQFFILTQLANIGKKNGKMAFAEKCTSKFNQYYALVSI